MAHSRSKAVHDSEVKYPKDSHVVNANTAATGVGHGPAQKEGTRVDNTTVHQSVKAPSHEFTIMGFPWQFVAIIGVIVCSLLVIALKVLGAF